MGKGGGLLAEGLGMTVRDGSTTAGLLRAGSSHLGSTVAGAGSTFGAGLDSGRMARG